MPLHDTVLQQDYGRRKRSSMASAGALPYDLGSRFNGRRSLL
jgi:hypothetical protein